MMRLSARTAFLIMGGLAVAVLVPVAVIIALGAYGASIGGSVTGVGLSGAKLSVLPAKGLPGQLVTVEGRQWPPRADVTLFVSRPSSDQGDGVRLRLARLTSSRSGTFALELVVPPALIGPRTQSLYFEAEADVAGEQATEGVPVRFEILPYPTKLSVNVTDQRSGLAIKGAEVHVTNARGQTLAAGDTGLDGTVEFSGIRPGGLEISASLADYLPGATQTAMPETGAAEANLTLNRDPDKRLFLGFAPSGQGALSAVGLDRASGLRVDLPVGPLAGNDWVLGRTARGGRSLFFFMPSSPMAGQGDAKKTAVGLIASALQFLGRTSVQSTLELPRSPAYAWLGGLTAQGEWILAVETAPAAVPLADIYVVNPVSGESRLLRKYASDVLPPRISTDGATYYFINYWRGRVEAVDAVSGKTLREITGLPMDVFRAVLDGTGRFIYLLTLDGGVFRTDLVSGVTQGPVWKLPGATWLASDRNGESLLLVGPSLDAMVVLDPSQPESTRLLPLEEPAYWVWSDPDGPFIVLGSLGRPDVTLIERDTPELAGRVELTSAPPAAPGT